MKIIKLKKAYNLASNYGILERHHRYSVRLLFVDESTVVVALLVDEIVTRE